MPKLIGLRGDEMFGETHYRQAYEQGLAWADAIFEGWIRAGRPVTPELPLTQRDAPAALDQPLDAERAVQARAESVLYAAARVRWRRLASRET